MEQPFISPNTIIIFIIVIIWMLFVYIAVNCALSVWSSSQSRISWGYASIRKLVFFILGDFFAIPIIYLLFSSFACIPEIDLEGENLDGKLTNIFHSELSCIATHSHGTSRIFKLLQIFTGVLFIGFCSILKILDFNSRIKNHPFGCKYLNFLNNS